MSTRILQAGLAALLLFGCSDRVYNDLSDPARIEITLDQGTALSLEAATSEFSVVVTRLTGETVVTRSLTLEGNRLIGEIGPLTANQVLRFTVEAAESATHTVLYRGSAIAKVRPYSATAITIDLLPVAPLVKFTPSYLETAPGLRFSVDTKLFNLTNAYGISYRVVWATPLGLVVDSVVPNPAIESDSTVIFFAQPGGGTAPDSYYAFSITETDTTSVIVDPAGDLDMVRLYFRLPLMYAGPLAFELSLEVTSLTENQNGQIVDLPVGTLYIDDCRVEIPLDFVADR